MVILDELVEILRFEFDDKDLKKFDGAVKSAGKAITGVAVAAGAAGAAIFAFVNSVSDSTDEMGKQAEAIGVSAEAYQELSHVAELSGASQNSLASSLSGLAKAASEASRGAGSGIEAFGILGVSATDAAGNVKDADNLLLDVADSIQGLSTQAEKIELLSKLGISEDMLLTLDQGSEALRRQMQEARALGFVLSDEAVKASAEFNDELHNVTKAGKGLMNQLAIGLMPQLTDMIVAFKGWFIANKAIIAQNLERFLNGLTTTIKFLYNIGSRVVSVIDAIAQGLGGWQNLLTMVAAAWAFLNANILLLPILAIAAGTAMLLLIEDVIAFAKGGDSAIQSLIDKFPMLEKPIRTIVDLLAMAAEGWRLIFTDGGKALEGLGILFDNFFGGGVNVSTAALTPSVGATNNTSSSQSVQANITVNAGNASGAEAKAIAVSVREEITKVMEEQNATAKRNLSGVIAQ